MKSNPSSSPSIIAALLGIVALSGCAQEDMPQAAYDAHHRGAIDGGSSGGMIDATAPDAPVGPSPDGGGVPPGPGQCVQALAQSIPASLAAMSGAPSSAACPPDAAVQDIVNIIASPTNCSSGTCHGAGVGGFQVASVADLFNSLPLASPDPFSDFGEWALAHIEGDATGAAAGVCDSFDLPSCEAMPQIGPGLPGKPWSTRAKNSGDPIVKLDTLLRAWMDAGEPGSGTFPLPCPDAGGPPPDAQGDGGAASRYAMTPAVGNGMTTLGNCIPDKVLIASDPSTMDALDQKFASMTRADAGPGVTQAQIIGLPDDLSETDVTSFDEASLARAGVVPFVPQYPLFTDDTDQSHTGKLRFVRVPRGQHIHFHKDTQEFDIPPNTRFYKTFFKEIVDRDGNPSWRKMETRLIVSRPDTNDPATGAAVQQNALYGTYKWNESETDATLEVQPLHDGTGFEDDSFEYDADLNLAAFLRASPPANMDLDQALVAAHAVRHYAIPSSTRCVDCHMGSPSQSFVLGFRPVQLQHRPFGVGGVIEPSGLDEMTQVQRLIDYGVIDGLDSPADILPLEQSQGDRKPRNNFELVAQGYMVGNCSHCHNPRGRPSVAFPVLRDVLSFLPGPKGGTSGTSGGIFQFPLEKFSPRIYRGIGGNVPIAYITPSLLDNPSYNPQFDPNLGDTQSADQGQAWLPKWFPEEASIGGPGFVYAPWRSLIYRNVETPFTYTDDYAIYPHMPINSPGFDVPAKRILGDWMVSIPAVRKRPDIDEYVQPYPGSGNGVPTVADANPQPYVEVLPGAPGYAAAQAAATARLNVFHNGYRPGEALDFEAWPGYTGRYFFSPDTWDIVDPGVDGTCHLVPTENANPRVNVPTHAHWVNLDLTTNSNDWVPRGSQWPTRLLDHPLDGDTGNQGGLCNDVILGDGGAQVREICIPPDTCGTGDALTAPKTEQMEWLSDILQSVTLDAARAVLTESIPMGLWQENPACNWSKDPLKSIGRTVADVKASHVAPARPPHWMDGPLGQDPTRHVYEQTMGAAVFNMICINCHGAQADSKGRLADNLATMTGGAARVADLRDGLFGPASSPGTNRAGIFAAAVAQTGASADDWGARYMAYMALGGTGVTIPTAFLSIVAHQPVFGELRGALNAPASANMLSTAKALCLSALQTPPYSFASSSGFFESHKNDTGYPILWDNYDAEMWLRLCSLNNPPPVAPYEILSSGAPPQLLTAPDGKSPTYPPGWALTKPVRDDLVAVTIFPVLRRTTFEVHAGDPQGVALVGDESGQVGPLRPDNLHPWCIIPRFNGASFTSSDFDQWEHTTCLGGSDCQAGKCTGSFPDAACVYPPVCPTYHDASTNPNDADYTVAAGWDGPTGDVARRWALRGAVNAGLAVFMYLEDLIGNHKTAQPTFDHCEQALPPDGGAP